MIHNFLYPVLENASEMDTPFPPPPPGHKQNLDKITATAKGK